MKYSELTAPEKLAVHWIVGRKMSSWWSTILFLALQVVFVWRLGWGVVRDNSILIGALLMMLIIDCVCRVGTSRLFKRCGVELAPDAKAAA